MTKDKRSLTSPENGKRGGRPQAEDRMIPVSFTMTHSLRRKVKDRRGSKYIRELIEQDKQNPAGD